MGTSIRRSVIWLTLAALAIAAAAWLTIGASATPGFDTGAPPDDTTGELKIVKNLGGGWPDGAFIFTWSCDDGQLGSAIFPDDFTGANFETGEEYPLGTLCTVEETDGVLSVSDYNVTTHIESTAGFQPINPRVVHIDNSVGQNTIQYMNELKAPAVAAIRLTKVGPDLPFGFAVFCTDGPTVFLDGGFALKGGKSVNWQLQPTSAGDIITCTFAEEQLIGWTTTIVVTGADSSSTGIIPNYPSAQFTFGAGDSVELVFTNTAEYLSVPPTGQPPAIT